MKRDHRGKLDRLRALDPQTQLFGATTHEYALGRKLTPKSVATLEKKRGVVLPDAYRAFLLEVGDGGAGPGYGLASVLDDETWECEGAAGGACIQLSDLGCDEIHRLVLDGRVKGEVWAEERVAKNFDDWYGAWLDESIVECAARNARETIFDSPNEDADVIAAVPTAEQLLEKHPRSVKAHDDLGMLLLYVMKPKEAIAKLERGAKLDGGLVPTSITLAIAYRLLEDDKRAIEIVNRALATKPTYFPHREALLWSKARSAMELGQKDIAVDAADEARTTGAYFLMKNQIDFFILAVQAEQRARADAAIKEFIDRSRGEATLAERRAEVHAIIVEAATAYELDDVAADYRKKNR